MKDCTTMLEIPEGEFSRKNVRPYVKRDLYRSNRSQTASVRTFKNDLMQGWLGLRGVTEERVSGGSSEEGNLLHVGDTRRPCTNLGAESITLPPLSPSCVYRT